MKLAMVSLNPAQVLFEGKNTGSSYEWIYIAPTGELTWTNGSSYYSTGVYLRDLVGWSHVLLTFDGSIATPANRLKLFVSGKQATLGLAAGSWPGTTTITGTPGGSITIGRSIAVGSTWQMDGYIADVHYADNGVLSLSDVTEFDSYTGQHQPLQFSNPFVANSGSITFEDPTSLTTLGNDYSPSGVGDWSFSGVSLTTGETYDSMIDVPTPWADGGNGRGNYCILDRFYPFNSSGITYSDGLLKATASANNNVAIGTFAVRSGKWYFECSKTYDEMIGWAVAQTNFGTYPGSDANGISFQRLGNVYHNGSSSAYGSAVDAALIGCALDLDNNKCYWSINGVWQNSADPAAGTGGYAIPAAIVSAISAGKLLVPAFRVRATTATENIVVNFGQRPFSYTPPTGFKTLSSLNMPDLPIASGSFTGNGAAAGPNVWANGAPETLTINGTSVVWGTNAIRTALGFRPIQAAFNASGTNTWTATYKDPSSKSATKAQVGGAALPP